MDQKSADSRVGSRVPPLWGVPVERFPAARLGVRRLCQCV